ncbi:sensor histidine kinase [Streptacidiphilus sp. NEAU-YB345]|uniref:histidine kinase n=1 Tax=Streptacidiphilus fuscans TaxID=2789292 RepID=A0A931FFG0_9ACTN|nr:sensor histidine kinase [Streptacidiphilus fuscans]
MRTPDATENRTPDVESWTEWPSREAISREGLAVGRRTVGVGARLMGLGFALWFTFRNPVEPMTAARVATIVLVMLVGGLAFWGAVHFAKRMNPAGALICLAVTLGQAIILSVDGAPILGLVTMCVIAIRSVQQLPLIFAAPIVLLGGSVFVVVAPLGYSSWGNLITVFGLGVLGYVTRQDWEARAQTQRTLAQERALRTVEAESAALAERARIAREIHDVLAHSLSAQLVHLEAARLMLDSGAERDQVRERIVAARRMAQDGLLETRASLSALRGEFTPVGEFLAKLTKEESAQLEVVGTPRPLTAEAGVAVRRTAQEALTNVRKHAPGSRCSVRLSYLEDMVELEVVNQRGPGRGESTTGSEPASELSSELAAELAGSGSGLGLLGMRERAELLGGQLEAGPVPGGFRVLLRVPC